MSLNEDLEAIRTQYQNDYPIERLKDFIDLPLTAATPAQLRGIFLEFDIPRTLAAVALANPNSYVTEPEDLPSQRMSIPAIITGDADYLIPSRHIGVPAEAAVLAVYGLRKMVEDKTIFIPQKVGAHRIGDMFFDMHIPLTPKLDLGSGRIKAYHHDGLVSRLYDSYAYSEHNPTDPTTPIRVIREISRLCLEAFALEELDKLLIELRSGQEVSV